jgi:DNA-binding transcriptional LysR family regulator
MDWDKLRIFHAVAQAGSFTHAGEALNLSQSAVSRQIGSLEESLKVHLFRRHARGLELTEQGELLYRTAHDVFGKVVMAEAMLADSIEKPRGELRVSATVGFGTTWLTPRLREFLDMYPNIRVRLRVSDQELDLSMREADVAIRMRAPTQPDLVQRRLLTVHHHIYAAPEYLKRHGTPQTLEELTGHRLIVYGEEVPASIASINWLMNMVGGPQADSTPVLH